MADGVQGLAGLIDHARRLGAKGAEVLVTTMEGIILEVQRRKIVRNDATHSDQVVVRCWDERGGEGVAKATSPSEGLVEEALAKAVRATGDMAAGPVGRLSAPIGGLGIDDRRHSLLTLNDRSDVILSAEKGARSADRRVRTDGFRYGDRRVHRQFVNSRGLSFQDWSTFYEAQGTVLITDDFGDIALTDELSSRAFASIASMPFGSSLVERLLALTGPPQKIAGPVRVLLPPRVVASLFEKIGTLFSVDDLETGRTFLGRAAQAAGNQPIFDTRVHLLDDGTVPGSLRTHAFDDRGVTPVPLTLLKEGKVDGRFIDPNTARRRDLRSTGHWYGDGMRPNNLILRGGNRSINVLLSEAEEPVLVVDAATGGLDEVTGEIRWRVFGRLIRKNQLIGPVRGALLTGNVLEVLKGGVDLASDTDRLGHVDAPGMLLDGFSAE